MDAKRCTHCEETKNLDEFYSNHGAKDGHSSWCKQCTLAQKREYHARPHVQARVKKYREDHKGEQREIDRIRNADPEIRDHKTEVSRIHRKNNPGHYREYWAAYERERKQWDPAFRMLKKLRGLLRHYLKSKNDIDPEIVRRLVGCTQLELKMHIERQFRPGMTWDNYGVEWETDHIKPCSKFNLLDPAERQLCFLFSNLQPLSKEDNMKKGNKYVEIATDL